MAVTNSRVEIRPPAEGSAQTTVGTWVCAQHREILPFPVDQLAALIADVPAWVLWDPSIVRVEHDQGLAGRPGMVCHVVVGARAAGASFTQMMMGADVNAIVFAGGRGDRWRFIDLFELTPVGDTTELRRRLRIEIHGWVRLMSPLVKLLARRYLARSLTALT